MQLLDFYKKIDGILLNSDELEQQLMLLRDLLRNSLKEECFRFACVREIITSIRQHTQANQQWTVPHFYYSEQHKYSLRMVFWPAFYDNNPHQHKTWSVTGVLHNKIDVATYHMESDSRRLKRDKYITASCEDAGFLLPGCIHQLRNPHHEISATLHIFNNLDINHPAENAIWYPSPRKYNLIAGLIDRALQTCIAILAGIITYDKQALLEEIFNLGSTDTKLKVILAMCKTHSKRANALFKQIGLSNAA